MLVQELLLETDDVLALVVVDEVHALQGGDDVVLLDAGLLADLIDRDLRSIAVVSSLDAQQDLQYGVGPVGSVAQQAQVGQRLLRASRLPLELGELVAELYEELAVTLPLVGRQGEDAGNVVVLAALLLLAEVTNNVIT